MAHTHTCAPTAQHQTHTPHRSTAATAQHQTHTPEGRRRVTQASCMPRSPPLSPMLYRPSTRPPCQPPAPQLRLCHPTYVYTHLLAPRVGRGVKKELVGLVITVHHRPDFLPGLNCLLPALASLQEGEAGTGRENQVCACGLANAIMWEEGGGGGAGAGTVRRAHTPPMLVSQLWQGPSWEANLEMLP